MNSASVRSFIKPALVVIALGVIAYAAWLLMFGFYPLWMMMTAPAVTFVFPDGVRSLVHVIVDHEKGKISGSAKAGYVVSFSENGTALIPDAQPLSEVHVQRARYANGRTIEADPARLSSGEGLRSVFDWHADDGRLVMTYTIGTKADEDAARQLRFILRGEVVISE